MRPDLVDWSSSLAADLAFVREDLLGSAAHATMLGRTGLVPSTDARALRDELLKMYAEAGAGTLSLPQEEDVHMAVEAELGKRLGATAGRLHAARSRNDQVATDLRLFVRRETLELKDELVALTRDLLDRARAPHETATILPAFTHRQRAQPVTAAYLICAWACDLVRAIETVVFAARRTDELALGSGACSGTSLPIDRELVRQLLGFDRLTVNALDAVGDRGFVLDWTWGATRALLALAKLSADVVDFATHEFGLVRLDGEVSAGSSMMPQKKNPDMFELVRGQASRGVASVVGMLTLVKGLPSGYNRDQQEDRQALGIGKITRDATRTVRTCLPHVHFDPKRGVDALAAGFTQATDLAEALVRKGVPFREAYRAVGELVAIATREGTGLVAVDEARAKKVHAALDAEALRVLDPRAAAAAKESPGGTGARSVEAQVQTLRGRLDAALASAPEAGDLDAIARRIAAEPLEKA
jgi:argininosuccinate lyase